MLGISSLLIDDPPALEVSDNNLGIRGVQRILAVHDFALAMVGSAHLVRLKSYSSKFLQLLTQRYEASSGLRPPSILEAQQADCKLWQLIYSLVQDKDWKLNDAIFEVTEVRGPSILEAQQADCKLWQLIYSLVQDKDWKLNDAIFEVTEVRGDMANLLQARPKPLLPLSIELLCSRGHRLTRFDSCSRKLQKSIGKRGRLQSMQRLGFPLGWKRSKGRRGFEPGSRGLQAL
eukprot:s10217_g1.t1